MQKTAFGTHEGLSVWVHGFAIWLNQCASCIPKRDASYFRSFTFVLVYLNDPRI